MFKARMSEKRGSEAYPIIVDMVRWNGTIAGSEWFGTVAEAEEFIAMYNGTEIDAESFMRQ